MHHPTRARDRRTLERRRPQMWCRYDTSGTFRVTLPRGYLSHRRYNLFISPRVLCHTERGPSLWVCICRPR
ncbi:hypothetical protein PVAG01_09344 [Phlyctema vagabunda]|uniref:Uncharacterized protein n=1 Tax=Phlyctema vagabunda TaxID=108571 RepID=A0ABR4P7H1_9HELO